MLTASRTGTARPPVTRHCPRPHAPAPPAPTCSPAAPRSTGRHPGPTVSRLIAEPESARHESASSGLPSMVL